MRGRTALLVLLLAALALGGLAGWRAWGGRGARTAPPRTPSGTPDLAPADPAAAEASATLAVEVTDGEESPVAGVGVSLTAGRAVVARGATDGAGIATFPGRTEYEVDVWVHPPDGDGARLPAGRFVPSRGDARITFVLRPARRLVLEVRCDGVPGLPDEWTLAEPILLRADADRKSGIIRGLFHPAGPDGEVRVRLYAPRYVDGGTEVRVSAETDPVVARIDLSAGHDLTVHAGRGFDPVRELRVEQKAPGGSSWCEVPIGCFEEGADGLVACSYRVATGACRVVLVSSGAIVGETAVRSADPELHLDPDLEGAGWCDVRVAVPEGHDISWSTLVVTGDRVVGPPQPRSRPGQWRVLVPGDRRLLAHAQHPLLVPARDGGEAPLAPGGSVTLKMVPGPLLRFRFGDGGVIGGLAGVTLRPYPGAEPVFRDTAVPVDLDGHVALTGWDPGVYTVTVDPFDGIPVTLEARLDPEGTNLGDLPFTRGSHVHVVVGGNDLVRVHATSAEQPSIVRDAFSRGGNPVHLLGLAPGTWDLRIDAHEMEYRRRVTVDGVTDVTLPLPDD